MPCRGLAPRVASPLPSSYPSSVPKREVQGKGCQRSCSNPEHLLGVLRRTVSPRPGRLGMLRSKPANLSPLTPSQTCHPQARSGSSWPTTTNLSKEEPCAPNLLTNLSWARRPFELSLGRLSYALASRCCTTFGCRYKGLFTLLAPRSS